MKHTSINKTTDNKAPRRNPWDEIFKTGIPSDLQEPYQQFSYIVGKLVNDKASNVLDVAMGCGRHAEILAKKQMTVFGFDTSKSGIDIAHKLFSSEQITGTFELADMFSKYPYEDNFFDAVIAIQAIYHGYEADMEHALEEISRVLKKGGTVFFTSSRNKMRCTMGVENGKVKKIDRHTYIPLEGREAGLVHFYPSEKMLKRMCKRNFVECKIIIDDQNKYFLVEAIK